MVKEAPKENTIIVHITGAVKNEGIVEVKEKKRKGEEKEFQIVE